MRPLRAILRTGQWTTDREEVAILEFLPGGPGDAQPIAVVADKEGRLSYHDVTSLQLTEEQRRELDWQTGWVS